MVNTCTCPIEDYRDHPGDFCRVCCRPTESGLASRSRAFVFSELGPQNQVVFVRMTEREVLELYFDSWSQRMRKADQSHLISLENCVDDWVLVNWAWEDRDKSGN